MIASFKMLTIFIIIFACCTISPTIQQTMTSTEISNETFDTENMSASVSVQTDSQQNITNFDFLDALEFVDPAESIQPFFYDDEMMRAEMDNNAGLAKPNATFAAQKVAVKKCVPRTACYKHEECGKGPRGSARCVGIFVGKCDCTACVSGLPCSSEATCGGLKNSCNNTTGICDCIKAHKANGFANFGQALLRFCNHEECDEESDTCFGLPCRRGRCVCL